MRCENTKNNYGYYDAGNSLCTATASNNTGLWGVMNSTGSLYLEEVVVDYVIIAKRIIDHLNSITKSAYRYSSASLDPIIKVLKFLDKERDGLDKYPDISNEQWCCLVINRKNAKWGKDPKMKDYLRPSTLFRKTNFENYLSEVLTLFKEDK